MIHFLWFGDRDSPQSCDRASYRMIFDEPRSSGLPIYIRINVTRCPTTVSNDAAGPYRMIWRSHSEQILVRGQGFEPRSSGPKPGVLPLDDPRILKILFFSRTITISYYKTAPFSIEAKNRPDLIAGDFLHKPQSN